MKAMEEGSKAMEKASKEMEALMLTTQVELPQALAAMELAAARCPPRAPPPSGLHAASARGPGLPVARNRLAAPPGRAANPAAGPRPPAPTLPRGALPRLPPSSPPARPRPAVCRPAPGVVPCSHPSNPSVGCMLPACARSHMNSHIALSAGERTGAPRVRAWDRFTTPIDDTMIKIPATYVHAASRPSRMHMQAAVALSYSGNTVRTTPRFPRRRSNLTGWALRSGTAAAASA